jgi:hypothetical protein
VEHWDLLLRRMSSSVIRRRRTRTIGFTSDRRLSRYRAALWQCGAWVFKPGPRRYPVDTAWMIFITFLSTDCCILDDRFLEHGVSVSLAFAWEESIHDRL